MPGHNYPIGIALKGCGGRKTKADRHIRSSRAKYRAFRAQLRKLVGQYQRKTGLKVSPELSDEEMDERRALDPDFDQMCRKVCHVRMHYLGF